MQNMTDTNVAVITYTDEDTTLVFSWHGGAYIEVGYPDAVPHEVINVWDDERDISRLEIMAETVLAHQGRPFRRTLELFEETCQNYLAEPEDDDQ